jgi:hypothetical protein
MRTPHLAIFAAFAALTGCSSFSATIVKADDAGVGGSSSAGGTTASGTSTSATSTMGGLTSSGGNTATAAGNSSTAGGTTATAGSSSTMGGTSTGSTSAVGGITSVGGASSSTVGGTSATATSTSVAGGTQISTGGTAPVDAGTGGSGGCDLSQPFGTPFQVVPSSLTSKENGISVSADGLTAIVAINPGGTGGNYDLKAYSRSSITVPFANQKELPGASNINTTSDDEYPRLSRDGLTLFYSICNHGGCYINFVTRTISTADFGSQSQITGISQNQGSSSRGPWISPDNVDFYWTESSKIYHATVSSHTSANVGKVTELNADNASDFTLALTDDQLTLYLSSDRWDASGTDAGAPYRIWTTMRTSKSATWKTPSLVTELDQGGGNHYVHDVSPDGCIIYFSALVDNQWHLYQASKP